MSEQTKILFCGDVRGRLTPLFNRLNKISVSAGPFDALFCVGDFFGDDDEEIVKLFDGSLKAPLPIYVTTRVPELLRSRFESSEGNIAENIVLLGEEGLYTALSGLRIVYLSVDPSDEQAAVDVEALSSAANFSGVDILLTNVWPKAILKNSSGENRSTELPDHDSGSMAIARLAFLTKPRYHFCATRDVYFERLPYRNHQVLVEKNKHVTRFIALAGVKNPTNSKYIYALKLVPMANMSVDELTAQPAKVTDNPYTELMKRAARAKEATLQGDQFFFSTQQDKRQHKKRHGDRAQSEHKFQEKLKMDRRADECWFCLGNPKVEKHLIVSIASQAYLALPRGPLVADHVMILTVGHHRNYVEAPPYVRKEIEAYKTALKNFFKAQDKLMVCFERNLRTQHYQLQCVPVPFRAGAGLKEVFLSAFASEEGSPCELSLLPSNALLEEVCKPNVPYSYVELPTGERLFNNIPKDRISSCNLQFGRLVLADEKILDCPEKVDWRECLDDLEKETQLAKNFREAFAPYEIE